MLIENGTVAVVWHNDLKPDLKDNASLLMAYNKTGLFPKLARVWVCWGDLRTDYVRGAAGEAADSASDHSG